MNHAMFYLINFNNFTISACNVISVPVCNNLKEKWVSERK